MPHFYSVLFFGLGAAICWGFADFVGAKASKKLGPLISAFLVSMLSTVLYVIIYLCFMLDYTVWSMSVVLFAGVAGVFISLGTLAFYKSLAIGPVSIVSPLSAAYPLVTTAIALTVFHAHLSAQQIIGIVLIVIGVMLASEIIGARVRGSRRIGSGPVFALLCVLGWGIGYTFMAQATKRSSWQFATMVEFVALLLPYFFAMPFIKKQEDFSWQTIKQTSTNKLVLTAGFILFLGGLAFNIGLSREASSGAIVSALSACYPAITIVLALRHFNETVKPVPMIGASMCIIGVIITTLG